MLDQVRLRTVKLRRLIYPTILKLIDTYIRVVDIVNIVGLDYYILNLI